MGWEETVLGKLVAGLEEGKSGVYPVPGVKAGSRWVRPARYTGGWLCRLREGRLKQGSQNRLQVKKGMGSDHMKMNYF